GGVFTIRGTNVYAASGAFPVTITINNLDGNSVTVNTTAAVASSGIVNRQLFYRNSPRYDVTDAPMPAYHSDNAIALDKQAYLPGAGTAGFQNITSYTRGINGLVIDVVGSHPRISLDDFTFRVGNNNAPGTWSTAPSPTGITVRPGAGVGGSDRVELTWA